MDTSNLKINTPYTIVRDFPWKRGLPLIGGWFYVLLDDGTVGCDEFKLHTPSVVLPDSYDSDFIVAHKPAHMPPAPLLTEEVL